MKKVILSTSGLLFFSLLLAMQSAFAQPIISSFTPSSAKVGTSVTITGIGFSTTPATNIVYFGATKGTVSSASTTQLIVAVPSGASYSQITVLNTETGLLAYSRQFFIPASNPSVSNISMASSGTVATGSAPTCIAVADFDGDGKPDMVATNNSASTISLYRNTTSTSGITPTFDTQYIITTGTAPRHAVVADFNGDGKPDIAVVNGTAATVTVLINNITASGSFNSGSFTAISGTLTTGTSPQHITAGDLNGDGRPDLVVANGSSSSLSIFTNTGTSTSSTAFSSSTVTTSATPYQTVIGDLDGDGKPDIAIAYNAGNNISILRNNTTSSTVAFNTIFTVSAGSFPRSITLADLDGDGKLDLATGNSNTSTPAYSISLIRNISSTGSLSASSFSVVNITSSDLNNLRSITSGDVDGDGKVDLAIANTGSSPVSMSVFRNTGLGSADATSFATPVTFTTGTNPQLVVIADLDGDGRADIMSANPSGGNTISIHRNKSITSSLSALSISAGTISSFASGTKTYATTVSNASSSLKVTPTKTETNATIQVRVNGGTYSTVASGSASSSLSLNVGSNTVDITVTAQDGVTATTYTITVIRLATQTITFAASGTKTFLDADYAPAGTTNSGLTISYASSNLSVATIINGNIHIIAPGTTTITASQAGDDAYEAATSINQTLTINKAAQAITFNVLSAITYGDADVDLSATSNSSLAVSYASSNIAVATILNGKIHIVGAGTTTITASQAGGTNYNAAPSADQSLTVNKAAQTITFSALNAKTYNDADFDEAGTTTSGLALSYSSSNTAVATIVSGKIHITGAGTATITASQSGDANYSAATSVDQSLTVNKASQTITFAAADTRIFGAADYADGATANSGLSISYSSDNTAVATIVSGKIHIVAPGIATITASQSGDGNHNAATSVNQTLTVVKASQTITFSALSAKTYNDTDFDPAATTPSGLTISYSSSNSSVATIVSGKIHIVGAGTTTITASQAGDGNYTAATSVDQSLTVNKASQTITFSALSAKTYNDADFDPAATTPSGLTLSYSSSNTSVATIVSGKIHIVGAGTATITAAQSGDGNYSAATSATQSLTVNKASQTITFSTLSTKTFGDADVDLTATSSSLLSITYSSDNTGVATILNGKIHIVGAGTATITSAQSGDGNYSAATSATQSLTVNKASQTITFSALSAKTYNDADFDPAGTASSNLALSYSSSNTSVATIVSGKIHIIGAGTTTITASQAGDGNYTAATSVDQSLTVNKAAQTITFSALSAKTYNDTDFDPAATTPSGLTISYSSSNSSVATIVSGKIHIVGAGTTTITASQSGDGNYTAATSVDQSLTVNKAAQTITFSALSAKTYNDTDFDPAATTPSGLTISYSSSNSSVATIVSGKIHIIGAGTTTITASQAGDGNYTAATSVDQSLTVNKASQTITFSALSAKTYNDTDFDPAATTPSGLTISYSSSNSSVATIVSGKIHIIGAGTTTITASQAGDGNYTAATSVDQSLTVNKASQTITFSALSAKTYNDADFDPAATTPSGLTISYSSSNTSVATIVSGQIHIIGAGTTTITASQSGSTNYTAATDVIQSLTVNKASQTITFSAISAKTYNDADFDPAATASSSLAISYSSSDTSVATIFSGEIHIVGAGTATITASQSGSDNYTAATSIDQNLTVNKASQSITFNSLNAKTYNDADFNPEATSSSSLAVSYSSGNTAVAAIVDGKIHIVGTGTATITAIQSGDGNYTAATSLNQLLSVNKASQTISFSPLSAKNYGDGDFDPGATSTSGLTINYSSGNLSVATVVDGKVHIVGAGTTTITATQAGNSNYVVAASFDQLLTINKASQVLTLTLPVKTYNDTDFDPTAMSTSGLVASYSSDNSSVATIIAGKIHIVGAGTSVITVTQSGNANYNAATTVNQTLTVNKATQTVTFSAFSAKTYGDTDVDPAATSSSSMAVAYSSGNTAVATIIAGKIHIVGTGTAVITAAQSGNENYSAAASINQTITVNKASQKITFGTLTTRIYPDTDFDPAATSTSGLAVDYSSGNTKVATIINGKIHLVAPGSSIITASQTGSDNYAAATSVDQLLTVINPISSNADLSGLVASTGLSQSFSSSVTSYTASVANNVNLIRITPVTDASTSIIQVNGVTVSSGIESNSIQLNTGSNSISVVVTAQDKVTTKTYNITVTRAYSSTADLSLLKLSSGTLYPSFTSDLISYSAAVSNSTSSITLTPVSENSAAIITVNGTLLTSQKAYADIALVTGKNIITSKVTAEDGVSAKTYTTTVIKAEGDQKVPDANGNVTLDATLNEVLVVSPVQPVTITVSSLTTNATVDYGALVSGGTGILPQTVVNSPVANLKIPASTTVKSLEPGWNGVIAAPVVSTYDLPYVSGETKTPGLIIEVGSTDYPLSFSRGVRLLFPGQAGMRAAYVHKGIYNEITTTGSSDTQAEGDALADGGAFKINVGADLVIWTKVFSRFITFSQSIDLNVAIVAADKDDLTIYQIKGANSDADNITTSLTDPLPAIGSGGSQITWTSDNAAVISTDGKRVNRPALGSGNTVVTLTATIKKGLISDTKSFILTVIEQANQSPTLDVIASQSVCYTTDEQLIALSGITPGIETKQSTIVSVSSNNANLFNTLSVTPAGGTAILKYSLKAGASGIAIVTVTVKDDGGTANGGIDKFTRTFTIKVNSLPVIDINSSLGTDISKGFVTNLTASGGVTYLWESAKGIISGQNTATLTVRPSEATTYTVMATNATGCTSVQHITINVMEDYKLEATNIITLNGDETNATFRVKNLDMYPNNLLKIFDKAGRILYTKPNYTNDWDGTIYGVPLAEDTYYYILDFGAKRGQLRGFISIIR
jgi:gliding motility-associated-like protein